MYTPRHWRNREQNTRLIAQECDACGFVSFPEQQMICKRCGSSHDWTETRLQKRGKVRSFVVQRRLPEEFETPLPFAIIDMPQVDNSTDDHSEPARVYGIVTEVDPEKLDIGMELVADIRRMYDIDGYSMRAFKFTLPRGDR